MFECLLIRRHYKLGLQILIGVFAIAILCNCSRAQFSSPAVSGVYNRAAGMGGSMPMSGGMPGSSSSDFGQRSGFGNGSSSQDDFYMGDDFMTDNLDIFSNPGSFMNRFTFRIPTFESIKVGAPEYVYKGHDAKEPALSARFTMYNNGREYKYAVLSSSGDTTAKLWDLDGKYDPETGEWFVTSGRNRKTYKDEHKQGVTKAIFAPDYAHVLTCSYDGIGRLWILKSAENLRAYTGAKDRLWSIDVTSSGEYVAAACNDGRVYFWEAVGTAKRLGNLPNRADSQAETPDSTVGHNGPIFDVSFNPTGTLLATAGADSTVRIWNPFSGRQIAVLTGHKDKVYSVKYSDNGFYILTASRDKTARLWDAHTGQEVCRYVGHTGAVREANFAGTLQNYVCTASDDGTVRLWNLQGTYMSDQNENNRNGGGNSGNATNSSSGFPMPTMPTISSASPYGMGASSGSMESGDSRQDQAKQKPKRAPGRPKGREIAVFEADSPVFSSDVSPDMAYVAGACADGTVKIWRVPSSTNLFFGETRNNDNFGSGMDSMPVMMGPASGASRTNGGY